MHLLQKSNNTQIVRSTITAIQNKKQRIIDAHLIPLTKKQFNVTIPAWFSSYALPPTTSSDLCLCLCLCRPNIGPNNLASKEHLPPQRRNIRSAEYFSIWLLDQFQRELGVAVFENTGRVQVPRKYS